MKGFVISWFFPPMNSSEGLVTFKLLKESNFTFDVFTQNTCRSWAYGITEEKLKSDNINPIFSEKETYDEWIEDGLEYFSNNRDKYDFIMSRATPKESHILALKIKEKYPDIPWIASFGDPLANSPYEKVLEQSSPYSIKGRKWKDTSKKYIISPKRILKNLKWNLSHKEDKFVKKEKKKAILIEKKTLEICDMIIFNNKFQKKLMLNDFDSTVYEKSIILNHSYDESFYPDKAVNTVEKTKIVYLGHLDLIRNAQVFLEAIKLLKDKNNKLSQKLEIEFYGNMSDIDKLYIINNELYDVVKVKKSVDYFTSLEIMKKNEWLLLIDANLESIINYNPYFAAKLADYIGAHKKIIAITMENGASSEIVKHVGGKVFPYDSSLISKYLKDIIDGKVKYSENRKNSQSFSNKAVAKIFDENVKKLVGEDK